jgi:alkylation response protein AidB-like acyl-CoA dehydrogenase
VTTLESDSVLAEVRSLAPSVAARATEIEAGRRLPLDLVERMASAGLFRLCVPKSLGGCEAEVATLLEAVETLSAADGAAGWCLMIGATTGLLAGFLPEAAAKEIYGRDPDVVTGGVFAPRGEARAVDGGYRVTGRWPFASGCEHCAWLAGGCTFGDGTAPRMLFFPASDLEIVDTWTVSGLAGTGSHDMVVDDVLVPAGRDVAVGVTEPTASGPLYRFPIFGLLAVAVAAVGLGIARAAIEELRELAGVKTPTLARRRLAEQPITQVELARAESTLLAARASLYDTVGDAWEVAAHEQEPAIDLRVRLRLAATHAARTSASVARAMYDLGGGSSIYATNALQRHFRDAHVVTQHMLVAPATYSLTGRLLLGLPTDSGML